MNPNPPTLANLRLRAIEATHEICAILDALENAALRAGLDHHDAALWMSWSIMPGSVMDAAKHSDDSRASAASRIEAIIKAEPTELVQ